MDVLEIMFASYIEAVSNSVHETMTDRLGTEVQAHVVEYNSQQVSYSYQLWRIQHKSVCGIHSGKLHKQSQCSQAAKRMFSEMCLYLQNNPKSGWRHSQTKNMYCNAATNYKPIIANVSFDTKTESQKAKEKCSVATLKVMQSATDKNIKERDQACGSIK